MKIKFGILLATSIFLMACNSDENQITVPTTSDVEGKVLDDPLLNAKICFDENKNMSCDGNEMSTFSTLGGQYNFTDVPLSIINTTPLLAEISSDTINEYSGLPAERPYRLRGYIGCTDVITPHTSMVQHLMDFGYQKESAIRTTQRKLMTEQALCSDHIAQSQNTELTDLERNEHLHLHKMANVFAGFLAINMEAVTNHLIPNVHNYSTRHSLIIHHQINELDAVIHDFNLIDDELSDEFVLQQAPALNSTSGFPALLPMLQTSRTRMILELEARLIEEEIAIVDNMMRSQRPDLLRSLLYSNGRNSAQDVQSLNGLYRYTDRISKSVEETTTIDYLGNYSRNYKQGLHSATQINHQEKYFRWNFETESFELINHPRLENLIYDGTDAIPASDNYLLYGSSRFSDNGWRRIKTQRDFQSRTFIERYKTVLNYAVESDDHLASGESYILDSKAYYVGGRKVKALLNLHGDVSAWSQIIGNDSTFVEGSNSLGRSHAHSLTISALNSLIFLNDKNNCDVEPAADVCNYQHIPVLVPSADLVTRTVYRNGITFSYQETDANNRLLRPMTGVTFEDVGLNGSNFFEASTNLTHMPILFQYKGDYIAVKLNSNSSADFYRIPVDDIGNNVGLGLESSVYRLDRDYIGRGRWSYPIIFGRYTIRIDVPESVRRLNPSVSSQVVIYSDDAEGALKIGAFIKEGEVISENVLGVPYSTHKQILDAIDKDKIREFD